MEERIKNTLTRAFSPLFLHIINDSARHAGHAGHDGKGESHFKIEITAPAFAGKPRLERHRMVYAALEKELEEGIHALQIVARTPQEVA